MKNKQILKGLTDSMKELLEEYDQLTITTGKTIRISATEADLEVEKLVITRPGFDEQPDKNKIMELEAALANKDKETEEMHMDLRRKLENRDRLIAKMELRLYAQDSKIMSMTEVIQCNNGDAAVNEANKKTIAQQNKWLYERASQLAKINEENEHLKASHKRKKQHLCELEARVEMLKKYVARMSDVCDQLRTENADLREKK